MIDWRQYLINRIGYSIRKVDGISVRIKTQFWPTCQQPVGPCSSIDLVSARLFILCIDFKRESKDDSDSGRMEEFRIKAAHQAKKKKKIEKNWEKKRSELFSSFY